jgi:hypothetical protein
MPPLSPKIGRFPGTPTEEEKYIKYGIEVRRINYKEA